MNKLRPFVTVLLLAAFSLLWVGCHADENDPAGQAEELSDPVRRQNAIENLTRIYTDALADHKGNRAHPEVKKIADTIHDDLTKTYINHPEDTQNGLKILDLLKEMRDPRTVDALIAALDWRTEVSEEHAIRAAQTLQRMEVPDDKVGEVVKALSKALSKVSDSRSIDNRMRINFIRALGALEDKRATKVLKEVATSQSEDQPFLINRLAAQQLGEIADPDSVPALIKCLFLFAPNNPAMRMNDVAAEALVRIGRPAYEPVLKVLKGEHEAANKLAQAYIDTIAKQKPQAAKQMSVGQVTSQEATFALGALGFADALEPLLKETKKDNIHRRINAAIQLVRLNVKEKDLSKIREAIKSVYEDAKTQAKPQLLAAARHTYDPKLLPFMMEEIKDDELHPVVRMEAVKAYALLANKNEAGKLQKAIENEPPSEEGGYREKFAQLTPALDSAKECDENLDCWVKKLKEGPKLKEDKDEGEGKKTKEQEKEDKKKKIDTKSLLLRKDAYMLGRLGRNKDKAIKALVQKLDHRDIKVRLAALQALDRIAVNGSEAAVDKIQKLRETEEGRSIWTQFRKQALPVQARLRTRAS
jgi:hypothetical protein